MEAVSAVFWQFSALLCVAGEVEGVDGVGSPAVGFVLASVTILLRGTSGVQPRDSEQ